MEQVAIWNVENVLSDFLFKENFGEKEIVALAKTYLSQKAIFDKLLDNLILIKQSSSNFNEQSSDNEIMAAIEKAKNEQITKDKMFKASKARDFDEDVKQRRQAGPLRDKNISERDREIKKRPQREFRNNKTILDMDDFISLKRLPYLQEKELKTYYDLILNYVNIDEVEKFLIEFFSIGDYSPDIKYNLFFTCSNKDGRVIVDDRSKKYENILDTTASEFNHLLKIAKQANIQSIMSDKIYFCLDDKYFKNENELRQCLTKIAQYICYQNEGVFAENADLKYMTIQTQHNSFIMYRIIMSTF